MIERPLVPAALESDGDRVRMTRTKRKAALPSSLFPHRHCVRFHVLQMCICAASGLLSGDRAHQKQHARPPVDSLPRLHPFTDSNDHTRGHTDLGKIAELKKILPADAEAGPSWRLRQFGLNLFLTATFKKKKNTRGLVFLW